MFRFVTILLMLVASPVFAQSWTTPARGTQTRQDLMDAIRAHAEWQLGAPVQFVVEDLRQAGDIAYGSLRAQRPGGGAIKLYDTPAYARGQLYPEELDGASYHVLYQRSGRTWVAVEWSLGATDVWWSWGPICR
ncbi:hypothetical protein, partial [Roseobacter sp.]|uniref:hypothetical protein n=1 Tax=Roseobacter sp. TaxID=1907202 RepID=UPI003299CC8A